MVDLMSVLFITKTLFQFNLVTKVREIIVYILGSRLVVVFNVKDKVIMASLLRNIARQGCQLVARNNIIYRQNIHPRLLISTSRKNKDAASISNHDEPVKIEENLADKEENWISYGYSLTDKKEDAWANNLVMFVIITVGLCWGSFIIAYMPDHKMRDWAQREAFLELARREKEGLPLIDRNLIDPAKIDLPPDEELADDEIII